MLTTRCPNCGRVFRIRPEQLGVRGGRVRCGTCQTAFSALQTLEELPDDTPLAAPPQPKAATPSPAATPAQPSPASRPSAATPPVSPASSPSVVKPAQAPAAPVAASGAQPPLATPASPAPRPAAPVTPAPAATPAPVARPTPVPAEPAPAAAAAQAPSAQSLLRKPSPEPAPVAAQAAPVATEPPAVTVQAKSVPPRPAQPQSEPDGRKEPSVESTWWEIDPNLPLGGFEQVVDASDLRQQALSDDLNLPQIPDAPPMIDPRKVLPVDVVQPQEPEPFRMEFDLSGITGEQALTAIKPNKAEKAEKAETTQPGEPYKSKIAEELGVAPFDPAQDDHGSMTYMLDDALAEPPRAPTKPAKPASEETSLLYLHEQQQAKKRRPSVEDRRKKKRSSRSMTGMIVLIVLLLAVMAAALAVYLLRVEIARDMPKSRPYLEMICAQVGCTVPYPHDSAQILIDGSNLVAEPGTDDRSRLIVTIRNKADYSVAWPYLELTLTDKFDVAVSRRVLKPSEWLPDSSAKSPALEAHSEVTTNVLLETGKPEPAGYRIYAFYP